MKTSSYIVTAVYTALESIGRVRLVETYIVRAEDEAGATRTLNERLVTLRKGIVWETCEAKRVVLASTGGVYNITSAVVGVTSVA